MYILIRVFLCILSQIFKKKNSDVISNHLKCVGDREPEVATNMFSYKLIARFRICGCKMSGEDTSSRSKSAKSGKGLESNAMTSDGRRKYCPDHKTL